MNIAKTEIAQLSRIEATRLTDEIRSATDGLYEKIREAHDGKAWTALGYDSWKAYVTTEFQMSERHSYRLLDLSAVHKSLKKNATDCPAGQSGEKPKPSGRASRALAKLPPEEQAEAWTAAVKESDGDTPTPAVLAKAVETAAATLPAIPPKEPKAPKPPEITDAFATHCHRVEMVIGKSFADALLSGAVVMKDLAEFATLPTERMKELEELVVGKRWTVKHAVRFLDQVIDVETRIQDLQHRCIAARGTFHVTVGGFEITVHCPNSVNWK